MTEKVARTLASDKAKGKKGGSGGDDEAAEGNKKKKLLLPIIIAVVVLVLAGGAGAFFLLKKPSDANAAPPAPKPGEVVAFDPISINLKDKHYLRIGIALQMTEAADAKAAQKAGGKALDLTISTFTGADMNELLDPVKREHHRAELVEKVKKAYEDEVITVYFTEFVTQ